MRRAPLLLAAASTLVHAIQGGPELALNNCSPLAALVQVWRANATGGNAWGATLSLATPKDGELMCMDIENFSTEPGAVVYTWPCKDGLLFNEAWAVGPSFIQSLDGGGMCLAATYLGIGGAITTAPCNAADPAQFLAFNASSGLIINTPTGLCVDAGIKLAWCDLQDHSQWPICKPDAPLEERAADIVSRLSLADKINALGTSTPALPSIGLPAHNWWGEGTHGISGVSYGEWQGRARARTASAASATVSLLLAEAATGVMRVLSTSSENASASRIEPLLRSRWPPSGCIMVTLLPACPSGRDCRQAAALRIQHCDAHHHQCIVQSFSVEGHRQSDWSRGTCVYECWPCIIHILGSRHQHRS